MPRKTKAKARFGVLGGMTMYYYRIYLFIGGLIVSAKPRKTHSILS